MTERRARLALGNPSVFMGRGAPPPFHVGRTPPDPDTLTTPDNVSNLSSRPLRDVSPDPARAPSGMAPGARGGRMSVVPREPGGRRYGGGPAPLRPLEDELDETLELLCHGEPLGPALARKAEREARALLLRRGLSAARVAAMIDAGAVVLHVELPPETPRVRSLVVRVGG